MSWWHILIKLYINYSMFVIKSNNIYIIKYVGNSVLKIIDFLKLF